MAMSHGLGQAEAAKAVCQKAYDIATAHNPTAVSARPLARMTLAG